MIRAFIKNCVYKHENMRDIALHVHDVRKNETDRTFRILVDILNVVNPKRVFRIDGGEFVVKETDLEKWKRITI